MIGPGGRLCRWVRDGAPCLSNHVCRRSAELRRPGRNGPFKIKHDGFRFLAVRQGKSVRIYSRGGHDWSKQLPTITEALLDLPVRSVVLDGQGVIFGPDGKSDFDRMRACFSREGAPEAFLYAFDVLELDGRDLRAEPWARRRDSLVQLWPTPTSASACACTSRTWTAPWCSGRRASWGWRALSPSTETAATAPGVAGNGSRSRTRRIRRSRGRC